MRDGGREGRRAWGPEGDGVGRGQAKRQDCFDYKIAESKLCFTSHCKCHSTKVLQISHSFYHIIVLQRLSSIVFEFIEPRSFCLSFPSIIGCDILFKTFSGSVRDVCDRRNTSGVLILVPHTSPDTHLCNYHPVTLLIYGSSGYNINSGRTFWSNSLELRRPSEVVASFSVVPSW